MSTPETDQLLSQIERKKKERVRCMAKLASVTDLQVFLDQYKQSDGKSYPFELIEKTYGNCFDIEFLPPQILELIARNFKKAVMSTIEILDADIDVLLKQYKAANGDIANLI